MKRRHLLILSIIAAFAALPAFAAGIGYVHYTPKKTCNPF